MLPLLRPLSPHFTRRLQLALTLLVIIYMLLVGGAFDATVRFQVQLLNTLAASALALGWLAIRLRQRSRLSFTGLEWPLAALAASQWLAACFSVQPRLSLEFAASVTAWSVAFLIVCDAVAAGWPRAYITNALLLAAFIVMAQGLWETANWFAGWIKLGQLPPTTFRLTGLLGHFNLTAAVLNLLLPLVIVQAIATPSRPARLGFSLMALGMLGVEFFTSSRAGWIALAAETGVCVLLWGGLTRTRLTQWKGQWNKLAPLARLSLSGLGLGLLAGGGWLLIRQTIHPTHGNIFFSRQEFWSAAWALFQEHPLTGAGPDLYAWLSARFFSVPPNDICPHAHSLVFQLLSGSGLLGIAAFLGLAAAGAAGLWRRLGTASTDRLWLVALSSSLVGTGLHQLFDYFFNAPAFVFLFGIISVLAFARPPAPATDTRAQAAPTYAPTWLVLPLALAAGCAIFSLRATALHEQGLAHAAQNDWRQAAQAFTRAAEADPDFPLYWEEAALAATRAGEIEAAIPVWQRVVRLEPQGAVAHAALAVLTNDAAAMQNAQTLAPGSAWLALNTGALREASAQWPEARQAYQQALNGGLARALFWQQTPFRASVLADWQATQPPDRSPLAQGWTALASGEGQQALALFEQARVEAPLSNAPYLGLARAAWALGDAASVENYLRIGQAIPVMALEQTIALQILEGDWAAYQGQRERAQAAYSVVFYIYNDYTSAGPGTYGYPWSSWVLFHRNTLPSDLIPQFVQANITAEIDTRLAQLAQWHLEAGQTDMACYIWGRVHREAPASTSGQLWETHCQNKTAGQVSKLPDQPGVRTSAAEK